MKKMKLLTGMMVMSLSLLMGVQAKASVGQTAETENSITVQWDAVDDAQQYTVRIGADYQDESGTPVVVPAGTNTYTFGGLKPGAEYYVSVDYTYQTSTGNTYESTAGSGRIFTKPGKVTGVNQEKWYYYINCVYFGWDECGDGYQYVVKNSKGKKFASGDTSSKSTSVYKVKNTEMYQLKVRANRKVYRPGGTEEVIWGPWSDTAYLFTQPMVKKLTVSGGKLKISFNKVSGLTSYDVFVSTKEKKGYKKVKTLKAKQTSLTVSKLKGKKFSYDKKYYVYIVGKKKVGKNTYTSGRNYSMLVQKGNNTLKWSFNGDK